eukprot:302792-Prorocentrum_minimum.AAC.1
MGGESNLSGVERHLRGLTDDSHPNQTSRRFSNKRRTKALNELFTWAEEGDGVFELLVSVDKPLVDDIHLLHGGWEGVRRGSGGVQEGFKRGSGGEVSVKCRRP